MESIRSSKKTDRKTNKTLTNVGLGKLLRSLSHLSSLPLQPPHTLLLPLSSHAVFAEDLNLSLLGLCSDSDEKRGGDAREREERRKYKMSGGGNNGVNKVFYATSYHPIQAGSIDGTDVAPHDNGVRRALLCYNAGLYDPSGDGKAGGDPYCTLFVGRISHLTSEETLREAMSKYGKVKSLRLVRHIVTGASRGYAFVEYETEKEMRRAYEDAHHSLIDGREIIVDYNRQQLMPGWIPRRLGGGLGGRKESGQLRFGGRERPFRAPLRPIPHEDLKKLGIQLPPEGRYMSRTQIPSPPRRKGSVSHREEANCREKNSIEREEERSPVKRERSYHSHRRRSKDREERYRVESRSDREERKERSRGGREDRYGDDKKEVSGSKRSRSNHGEEEERSHKRHKHRRSHHHRSERDRLVSPESPMISRVSSP